MKMIGDSAIIGAIIPSVVLCALGFYTLDLRREYTHATETIAVLEVQAALDLQEKKRAEQREHMLRNGAPDLVAVTSALKALNHCGGFPSRCQSEIFSFGVIVGQAMHVLDVAETFAQTPEEQASNSKQRAVLRDAIGLYVNLGEDVTP